MPQAADALEVMERLTQLGSDLLAVRPERCVCVRNRHANCTRCSDACTSGALYVEAGALCVSPDLCVGCGTCATVCPTCALEIAHPNDASLLAQARARTQYGEGEVVFACHRVLEQDSRVAAEGSAVPLVCLSRLEESLLVTLMAEGVRRVRALCADCENCPRHDGIHSARLVEETVATIVHAWNVPATFAVEACGTDEMSRGLSAANVSAVREKHSQDAFHSCAPLTAHVQSANNARNVCEVCGADYAADSPRDTHLCGGGYKQSCSSEREPGTRERAMLAHVSPDGTLPHFVPVRRGRLLDALATFGEPVEDVLKTRLWGHVDIDMTKCKSCRMCAVFCPTGALCKFEDENGQIGIEHYVAECVHCLLCQDICSAQAITNSAAVPALQLAHSDVERYPMPQPEWVSGPDQIVRKMEKKISGNAVTASYSTEMGKERLA